MKNIFMGILSATALAASTIAMAGGPDNMATPAPAVAPASTNNFMSALNGLYVGTDLGYAITPNEFTSASNLTNDGFTFAFHAGYNFNQYLALEAGYTRLPKVGYNDTAGNFIGTDNNDVYSFVVKGTYPVINKLNVFAKAGYALSNSDSVTAVINGTTSSAGQVYSNPTVSGGIEYRVMPHVGVNVQYTAIIGINGQAATSDLATAGLNYYF